MAGKVIAHLLPSGLSEFTGEFNRSTNKLVILHLARLTHKVFVLILDLALDCLPLLAVLNLRCPKYPSLITAIPIFAMGSYESTRMDYLGPVKPGLSNHTSIS